jgi:hypothetical protein
MATFYHSEQAANITRQFGGKLEWEPVAERFTNSEKANISTGSIARATSCRRCDRQDVSAWRSFPATPAVRC